MKLTLFKLLYFCLVIFSLPTCVVAYGGEWYFGFFGDKMICGKDYDLSLKSDFLQIQIQGLTETNEFKNLFDPGAFPEDQLFVEDSLSFERGSAFGINLGFASYGGLFFEAEFGVRSKVDEVELKIPHYIDAKDQFMISEAKTGFLNIGYKFVSQYTISPFVSAGLGVAKVSQYGEYRLGLGNRLDENSPDTVDYQTFSENRGHFETEFDLLLVGNLKAGLEAKFGESSVLLSYRLTSMDDKISNSLKDFKSFSRNPKWTAQYSDSDLFIEDAKEDVNFRVRIAGVDNNIFDGVDRKTMDGYSYSDHAIEISIRAPIGRTM